MIVAAWILQVVLALVFLAAGGQKLVRSKPALVSSGMGFAEDFSGNAVKAIGVLEILGAIGLIVPALTGIAPILVPLAAVGLTLTMVGAVVVHVRRKEPFVPPLVLGVLALVLAVLRFAYPA